MKSRENRIIGVSINRTIVELKYVGKDTEEGDGVYQSYHRGIEIRLEETHRPACRSYQSYHRGIEMLAPVLVTSSRISINRTIVELKWQTMTIVFQTGILSIVPSWN